MSLVGFRALNHPQQPTQDDVNDRATTPDVFAHMQTRFGTFTVDVAAAAHNTKVARYFTREQDGVRQSWSGERVWCNPPYSDIAPWVHKAWDEQADSRGIVMLASIDHINGDRADNRIANLRQATTAENSQNERGPRAHATSGFLGVGWHAQQSRWRARITVNGKRRHLGLFDTPEAAYAAYVEAKRALHPFSTL